MRLPISKSIEGFFKALYSYSHIGKLSHYLRNHGNPDVVFIWIPKNAGTSLYPKKIKQNKIEDIQWQSPPGNVLKRAPDIID